jgi:hypothetical protein
MLKKGHCRVDFTILMDLVVGFVLSHEQYTMQHAQFSQTHVFQLCDNKGNTNSSCAFFHIIRNF